MGPFGDRPPLRDTLTGGRPPGREMSRPLLWGGLTIIGGNGAKCRHPLSGVGFGRRGFPYRTEHEKRGLAQESYFGESR